MSHPELLALPSKAFSKFGRWLLSACGGCKMIEKQYTWDWETRKKLITIHRRISYPELLALPSKAFSTCGGWPLSAWETMAKIGKPWLAFYKNLD